MWRNARSLKSMMYQSLSTPRTGPPVWLCLSIILLRTTFFMAYLFWTKVNLFLSSSLTQWLLVWDFTMATLANEHVCDTVTEFWIKMTAYWREKSKDSLEDRCVWKSWPLLITRPDQSCSSLKMHFFVLSKIGSPCEPFPAQGTHMFSPHMFWALVMSCHIALPHRFITAATAVTFGTIVWNEYRGRGLVCCGIPCSSKGVRRWRKVHLDGQRSVAEVTRGSNI